MAAPTGCVRRHLPGGVIWARCQAFLSREGRGGIVAHARELAICPPRERGGLHANFPQAVGDTRGCQFSYVFRDTLSPRAASR